MACLSIANCHSFFPPNRPLKRSPIPLKIFPYLKRGIDRYVAVFLMKVIEILDQWPEKHERRRCWVTQDEAETLVDDVELRCIIKKAFEKIGNATR